MWSQRVSPKSLIFIHNDDKVDYMEHENKSYSVIDSETINFLMPQSADEETKIEI